MTTKVPTRELEVGSQCPNLRIRPELLFSQLIKAEEDELRLNWHCTCQKPPQPPKQGSNLHLIRRSSLIYTRNQFSKAHQNPALNPQHQFPIPDSSRFISWFINGRQTLVPQWNYFSNVVRSISSFLSQLISQRRLLHRTPSHPQEAIDKTVFTPNNGNQPTSWTTIRAADLIGAFQTNIELLQRQVTFS